jgi:hypothetical protein
MADMLKFRVLAALGGLRDDMTPEDVAAVQRFVKMLPDTITVDDIPNGSIEPSRTSLSDMLNDMLSNQFTDPRSAP